MINKIIASYIFICLLFAIALKLGGVDSTEQFGVYLRTLVTATSKDLAEVKLSVPDIPKITIIEYLPLNDVPWYEVVVNVLVNLGNSICRFFNIIISLLNIVIKFLNIIIQLFEFIIIFIKNIISIKNIIIA